MPNPTKCPGWPHAFDASACSLDRAQWKVESRRRETQMDQRDRERTDAHDAAEAADLEAAAPAPQKGAK